MKINLQVACDGISSPNEEKLQCWLDTAAELTPQKIPENQKDITIRVVDREESAHLNQEFRHKIGPTNVLSFPPSSIPGFELDSLGDLAICAPVVKEEAKTQHKALEAHWAHMVIHGFLHLLGYDHIKDDEAEIMEALETRILKKLNFADPYQ